MTERDKSLDRLRGFAMLWVIVVHVLYWTDFIHSGFVNVAKSFCLFEMPLFFFITGASNAYIYIYIYMHKNSQSYWSFVRRRFLRVLIPYEVFACICAAICLIVYARHYPFTIGEGLRIVISWLLPIE